MAGTLQVQIKGNLTNGYYRDTFDFGVLSSTQATASGPPAIKTVQSIGFAADEVVALGDLAAADQGYFLLKNLDATNYIDFGPDNSGSMLALGRLLAGEEACLRLKPSTVLRAQANTAACLLLVFAVAK